jgi:hypothetical protein
VPLYKNNALKLVNEIQPYVEWQSTTSYLKDPPSGYQMPDVDLHAEFKAVAIKIMNGTYINEYDF